MRVLVIEHSNCDIGETVEHRACRIRHALVSSACTTVSVSGACATATACPVRSRQKLLLLQRQHLFRDITALLTSTCSLTVSPGCCCCCVCRGMCRSLCQFCWTPTLHLKQQHLTCRYARCILYARYVAAVPDCVRLPGFYAFDLCNQHHSTYRTDLNL